ncbi:hypothetical protein [Sulfurovum sp.]|jgi:hypothetical protein|uniref:hypothetical protein n=1 Tax=Sulfurovum sp. TaxID=1969726 RepID=UPI002A35A49A|nr:hypothetical protein [Sulfurovum sp.]MDY0403153.1 hypothetical protein [Sulfurovum sp.]
MAKTNYSYQKRGREIEKQKKQEEKRQKKLNKKKEEEEEAKVSSPQLGDSESSSE